MGLIDSYKAIRGQILMMSPLPSISTVHSLLIHEERQREISAKLNLTTDSMAMHVNNSTPNYQSSKKYCSNCKKIGHVKSQCYRLIGFPSDFKFTKSKKFEFAAHNVVDNTPDNNQGISPDEYKQLIELLSKVNINEATRVNYVLTDGAMDTSGDFLDSHGNHVSYALNVVMGSNQETWVCLASSIILAADGYGLGHLPIYKMRSMSLLKRDCNEQTFNSCGICHQARQHKLSFTTSDYVSNNPFDLLHVGVWGPYKVETYNGFKYFLTLVDDYSRCTWVHLMKHKSSAFTFIQAFIKYVKNQFNINVKTIRTDNAFEMGSSNEGIKFFQE
uniref:Integrase catalytic domain-containing protein n=1 Tax=Lactuca sativa TaxID=4236 RepID=A0A9R1XL82_LACSA|nr:hypothetical protein LSAT_V11C400219650 [Lactuca sativa]